MSTSTQTIRSSAQPLSGSSATSRWAILFYGVASYAIGVSGLLCLILATLDVLPFGLAGVRIESRPLAIVFSLAFVALFGIQHAVMARPAFKERWTRIIPAAAERSTFTLLAGVIMGSTILFWQPMGEVVWQVSNPTVGYALTGLCALGWAYLLAATFAIDHFELFGLKQVFRNLRGEATPEPSFVQRFMYRFDRHPIMTGVLFGIWATPVMRVDHLILALGLTTYVIIGVRIETRDLVKRIGEPYREYMRNVKTLVPFN